MGAKGLCGSFFFLYLFIFWIRHDTYFAYLSLFKLQFQFDLSLSCSKEI